MRKGAGRGFFVATNIDGVDRVFKGATQAEAMRKASAALGLCSVVERELARALRRGDALH